MFEHIELIEQQFQFGEKTLTIKRVKNLDDMVDRVSDADFAEDERLPYWAELWPSAEALSRFLFQNPHLVAGRSVLELGCGLGLTSLSLACQKPRELLVTDYEQDALDLTALNFKLNGMPAPQRQLMDWRRPQCAGLFDCITASDVVYEERFFHPLIRVFRQCLKANGYIILAEPNRAVARSFFSLLREERYGFERIPQAVMQEGRSIQVSIYIIRRI